MSAVIGSGRGAAWQAQPRLGQSVRGPPKRSTLIFRYPQAGRPITPSIGGKPADMCSLRGFRILTPSRHWPDRNPAAQQYRRVLFLSFKHGMPPSPPAEKAKMRPGSPAPAMGPGTGVETRVNSPPTPTLRMTLSVHVLHSGSRHSQR
jgi:hypothetical protein